MAQDKTITKVSPPFQDKLINPETGYMARPWELYFLRLPLTLTKESDRLDTAEATIVVIQGDITTAEAAILALQTTIANTPLRLNTVELSAQAASITATDFSGGTLAAGLYLATYYARITQAATVSSSLEVAFGWTDGAVLQSFVGDAITGNTTATSQSGTVLLRTDAGEDVTYETTYASVGATEMEYSLDVVLLKVDA